jgi:hypothetical protein
MPRALIVHLTGESATPRPTMSIWPFSLGFSLLLTVLVAPLYPVDAQDLELTARFDVATFCCPCTLSDHFCEPQFDVLNRPGSPGHYLAMGTDWRRSEVEASGNRLAFYYNSLNTGWTQMTGKEKAGQIWNVASANFLGGVPQYFILNEISAGLWPNNALYRVWVREVVLSLKESYDVDPILASPFSTPGQHDADWQAVAAFAYIAAEVYLSGLEIMNAEFSVAWCEQQYAAAKRAYLARGVPESRLMLIEHFGQTTDVAGGAERVSRLTIGRPPLSFGALLPRTSVSPAMSAMHGERTPWEFPTRN